MAKETLPTGPNGGDEDLKLRLEGLTDEQKDKLFEILKREKIKRLMGKKEEVFKYTKENYVQIVEGIKFLGYEGKRIHIDLPAVGDFKGFKSDYFVSDENITEHDLKQNQKLKDRFSSSEKQDGGGIGYFRGLSFYIENYLKNFGIEDKDFDFLINIVGLKDNYRGRNCRIYSFIDKNHWLDNISSAKLILKM